MIVSRVICDAIECENDARFHIVHEFVGDRLPVAQGRLVVDLCPEHAQGFNMTGTGAWDGVSLKEPR